MERKEGPEPAAADNVQARREQGAQEQLLARGADSLAPRPWRPAPAPPTAVDLTQFALWRASDLTAAELLAALALLPAARAEVDGVESGLLFIARGAGLTWAQIAEATGFRSPQACQQYYTRLAARAESR
ncbi:DNA-binding protein [Ruania zhangjianzhongii]|uniref:DNA-binding protein n=1 Tax=Ruania zhangjianzhongii TaxID=2603206 RepID=UPI0011CA8779|nr:DNA-binding protein [Ruania zhangjianzhongii]